MQILKTDPIVEKREVEKREVQNEVNLINQPKTPSQTKHIRIQWTLKEKKCFFDALYEHGRDFEQISRFINMKMKRKNPSEADYKSKEHVRQHYYQLFQKASKYLKFSDDVKKLAQELYVLINYGEMKKKLIMSSEKSFLKLRDLVYRGSVTVRVKGKNIKIKTPSCRALKKLNQLEGNNMDDIQLPQRIDVFIRPSNLESWTQVQKLSQNPRIKVSLPLQKRIISLLQTLEQKWRSNNMRLQEKYVQKILNANNRQKQCDDILKQSQDDENVLKNNEPHLCFHPPENCKIFRPMIQLNELLSSYSICLNSYEDRIGAKKRSEEICMEKSLHIKELAKNNAKRIRNDSFSEKINAHVDQSKKSKIEENMADDLGILMQIENDSNDSDLKKKEIIKTTTTTTTTMAVAMTTMTTVVNIKATLDDVCEIEKQEFGDDRKEINDNDSSLKIASARPRKAMICSSKNPKDYSYKPLINEDALKKIREGWTVENVGDLTIGDLYLLYGSDSKLVLEYKWNSLKGTDDLNIKQENAIGGKLKHLMMIASLVESPNATALLSNKLLLDKNLTDTKELSDNALFRHPSTFENYLRPNMNPRLKPNSWRSHHYRYRSDGVVGDFMKNNNNQNHVVRNLYQTPSTSKEESKPEDDSNKCEMEVSYGLQKYSDEVTKILEDKIQNLSKQPHVQNFSESSRSSIKSLLETLSSSSSKATYEDNLASLRFWDNIQDKADDIDNISLSSLLGHLDSFYGTSKTQDDGMDD